MYPVNPMQVIQAIRSGQNPQQIMLNIVERQMANTPMGANLMQLIKEKRTQDIEQLVRNVAQSRGVDFDKEFPAFKQRLGL